MSGDDVGWASTSSPGIEEVSIMHMLDWNKYRQQLVAGVGGLGKLNPDIVKGYTTLSRAGHLDEKTRELIALAVAITLRCYGCITVHAAAARQRGATKQEIAEVLGVAVSVHVGAARSPCRLIGAICEKCRCGGGGKGADQRYRAGSGERRRNEQCDGRSERGRQR